MRLMSKTILAAMVAIVLALGGCHNAPKTNVEKIDSLKQQLMSDAQTLQDLEAKEYPSLEKDFMACDSMLQYQDQEQLDASFEHLLLVQAYLEQFKVTRPLMQADIDSTLLQLDRLKADAESQYLSDSLVTVYLEDETACVEKINNQVRYFQDRFSTCKKDLNTLKKQK